MNLENEDDDQSGGELHLLLKGCWQRILAGAVIIVAAGIIGTIAISRLAHWPR